MTEFIGLAIFLKRLKKMPSREPRERNGRQEAGSSNQRCFVELVRGTHLMT